MTQNVIRGALFDLDNTLFDRDSACRQWARTFIDEQFEDLDAEGRGRVLSVFMQIDRGGLTPKTDLFMSMRHLYPSISQDVPTLCERFYAEWLQYMELYEDSVVLLDFLAKSAIPFGIITNGPQYQAWKIEKMRLRERTECIFISELFGAHKPDPSIFLAGAEKLGLPPSEILFVGDNVDADIRGAQSVGMRTAWRRQGRIWDTRLAPPDFEIDTLTELLTVLKG